MLIADVKNFQKKRKHCQLDSTPPQPEGYPTPLWAPLGARGRGAFGQGIPLPSGPRWGRGKVEAQAHKGGAQRAEGPGGTRQVHWVPGLKYTLLRIGTDLSEHPETLYKQGLLLESHLYHYVHVDPFAARTGDKQNTKYMAVLRWNNAFIRPQFKYLHQCYANRCDASQQQLMQLDGTPYWCDIYLKHCQRRFASV